MGSAFRNLKAVVLDWAGTTTDFGSRAPAIVFQEIFRRTGIEITPEQARGPMGMAKRDHIAAITKLPDVHDRWLARFGGEASDSDVDRMYAEFLPLQKETLAQHSDVIPGVAAVIDECRQRGLKIGSSTGYTHDLMEVVLPIAAAQGYRPDCVICSDDVHQGRPAPWMLLEATKQLDVYPPSSVVKVDDTGVGIEAGRNAGTWTIGISTSGNGVGLSILELKALTAEARQSCIDAAAAKLRQAGAHFVIESVADMIPILEAIESRMDAT
ncbi:MAG: phosphonoacetaldehyde hydrolase [Planctomycetota bacterium]|nr:phosphonoacetaldehyde hydrolase [Planctomycetota bacterium]